MLQKGQERAARLHRGTSAPPAECANPFLGHSGRAPVQLADPDFANRPVEDNRWIVATAPAARLTSTRPASAAMVRWRRTSFIARYPTVPGLARTGWPSR